MNQSLRNKVAKCKTADEVLKLAKDNCINITLSQAEKIFKETRNTITKLSDEELNDVAGGLGKCGTGAKDAYELVKFKSAEEVYYIFEIGQIVQIYNWTYKSYTIEKKIDNRKIIKVLSNDGDYYLDQYHCEGDSDHNWYPRSYIEKPQ